MFLDRAKLPGFFSQQKDLSLPFEMELTEQAVSMKNDYGNSRLPWDTFLKWKENREMILLYRSDYMFHMIPKRLISSEDEMRWLQEIIRRNNIPYFNRGRFLGQSILIYFILIVVIGMMLYMGYRR